jgi:hypothetical protein
MMPPNSSERSDILREGGDTSKRRKVLANETMRKLTMLLFDARKLP